MKMDEISYNLKKKKGSNDDDGEPQKEFTYNSTRSYKSKAELDSKEQKDDSQFEPQ